MSNESKSQIQPENSDDAELNSANGGASLSPFKPLVEVVEGLSHSRPISAEEFARIAEAQHVPNVESTAPAHYMPTEAEIAQGKWVYPETAKKGLSTSAKVGIGIAGVGAVGGGIALSEYLKKNLANE